MLDAETIAEVRARPELQESVRASLARIRRFYEGSPHWITPGNHNYLRITRILKCLKLLGLDAEAAAFFEYLAGLRPRVPARSFDFWRDAWGRLITS